MLLPSNGFQKARPKHIRRREQAEQVVFGAAFHAGPHLAAFRLAIGARPRDIAEDQVRIEPDQHLGNVQREVVRDAGISGLLHAYGRHARAKKAGGVAL